MLYPTQDGQICVVIMLQNMQDLLHTLYNSYSVHKHHTAEAFNELKVRINETNQLYELFVPIRVSWCQYLCNYTFPHLKAFAVVGERKDANEFQEKIGKGGSEF